MSICDCKFVNFMAKKELITIGRPKNVFDCNYHSFPFLLVYESQASILIKQKLSWPLMTGASYAKHLLGIYFYFDIY